MSSNFVIEHSNHSTFSILAGKLDIHLAFSSFRVMCHAGWCHLIFLEVNGNPLLNTKCLQIVFNILVGFFLIKLATLTVKIIWLWAILLQKTVEYFLSDLKVLSIRLDKLFEELLGLRCIFIFKLWIDLKAALEESVVTLLQVLGQSMIKCLQLEAILLGLLHRSGCRGVLATVLHLVQSSQLLRYFFVVHELLLLGFRPTYFSLFTRALLLLHHLLLIWFYLDVRARK